MPTLTFLGITGNQTPTTETVSFVIQSKATVLFEPGPAVVRQLNLAGIPASNLDAIFVSHCHGDHTLGFPYLMFTMFVERTMGQTGPEAIQVYALPQVRDGLQEMWRFCYPPGAYQNFEVEWVCPEPFQVVEIGDLRLTFAPADHRVPVLAVRLDSEDGSIVYSADTVYCENVVSLARECDLLIHEGAMTAEMEGLARNTKHSLARDAGTVAKEAHAKRLMLVHMFDRYVGRYDPLIAEAKEAYDGEVLIPEQLVPYDIRG